MSYIDSKSAIIFSSGSEDSLTSSISKFLDMNNKDRSKMILESAKIVEIFNFKNISKEHNDYLFKNS